VGRPRRAFWRSLRTLWIHSSDALFRFAGRRLEFFIDDLPWRDYIKEREAFGAEPVHSCSHLETYPSCDIDKVRERGETWAVDPETGEAINRLGAGLDQLSVKLDRLGTDLRGEIRSTEAETRVYVDERIQGSTASLLQELGEFESRTRRHFDVVAESLRSDIRAVAEGMAASREQTDRRIDEQAGRTDGLDGRVLRLEVDVSRLKAGRKPRRPRRR
jgi:hypothetical protein